MYHNGRMMGTEAKDEQNGDESVVGVGGKEWAGSEESARWGSLPGALKRTGKEDRPTLIHTTVTKNNLLAESVSSLSAIPPSDFHTLTDVEGAEVLHRIQENFDLQQHINQVHTHIGAWNMERNRLSVKMLDAFTGHICKHHDVHVQLHVKQETQSTHMARTTAHVLKIQNVPLWAMNEIDSGAARQKTHSIIVQ